MNGLPAPQHKAAEDTFCLQLNKPAFIKLFALSSPFRDFALRGVSSLLDQVNQQVQQKAVETLGTRVFARIPAWANWPCATRSRCSPTRRCAKR